MVVPRDVAWGFYQNLQENSIRKRVSAVCKLDLRKQLGEQRGVISAFAKKAGISRATLNQVMDGKAVNGESAGAIADALGMKLTKAFIVRTHAEPLAASSVISYHRTLSSILGKAVKWEYISSNPAEKAEKPGLGNHEAAFLEEADARRLLVLLQTEPIKWRAVVTFDLLSGLRRQEILGLRWRDADLNEHTITIRQTSNYLLGLGVYASDTKNASSARPLRLSTAAIAMLLEYKAWQDDMREKLGDAWMDKDGRVFTNDLGAPMFPVSVTAWFSDFIARSGMPKVTVHSLRHTYASLMIADGVPVIVVSRQLGHAQTSTTQNIYAHVIRSAEAKAMQTFDRFNDLVPVSREQPASEQIEDIPIQLEKAVRD